MGRCNDPIGQTLVQRLREGGCGRYCDDLEREGAAEIERLSALLKLQQASYEREIALDVAAERERCASAVRYWLTGHAPAAGTHEARCLAHVLDGRTAPAGWTEKA